MSIATYGLTIDQVVPNSLTSLLAVLLDNGKDHMEGCSNFYCPAPCQTNCDSSITIPMITTERDEECPHMIKVFLSYGDESRDDDYLTQSLSTVVSSYFYLDVRCITHNFTFLWTTNHDYFSKIKVEDPKLAKILKLNDHTDILSPDFIHYDQINKTYYIVEFTTTESHSEQNLKRCYDVKLAKYSQALKKRTDLGCKIMFYVIVVSRGVVYSNLRMPKRFMQELVNRYFIGLEIKYTALSNPDILCEVTPASDNAIMNQDRIRRVENAFTEFNLNQRFKSIGEKSRLISEATPKPDHEYIKNAMSYVMDKCVRQAAREYVLQKDTIKLQEIKHNEFTEDLNRTKKDYIDKSTEGLRFDSKTIVQVPLIAPVKTQYVTQSLVLPEINCLWSKIIERSYDFDQIPPLYQLWLEAARKVLNNEVFGSNNRKEELEMAKLQLSDIALIEAKKRRKEYRRVQIDLSPAVFEVLAIESGLMGKKLNKKIKIGRESNKFLKSRPFHPDASTKDIQLFLDNQDKLIETCFFTCEELGDEDNYSHKECISDLIESSLSAHIKEEDTVDQIIESIDQVRKTQGMVAYRIISSIAGELLLSFHQNPKNMKTFILKKLLNFNIYILIKPTCLHGPMFFSLLWEEKDFVDLSPIGIYRTGCSYGPFKMTEFCSVTAEKAENWLKAEGTYFSMTAFWKEFHGISPIEGVTHQNSLDDEISCRFMTQLSMLISLENKSSTEEIITKSRYVFMEGFVSQPCFPNPGKMLKKFFSAPIRSRLALFCLKKILDESARICLEGGYKPVKVDELNSESGTEWINLVNPYNKTKLKSPYQLVNLMYIGYLKDKSISNESNTEFKLFEKILEKELDFDENVPGVNGKDPDFKDCKIHEFSPSLIRDMLRIVGESLQLKHGHHYLDAMHSTIIRKLSGLFIESSSTLKASSNFSSEWEYYETIPQQNKTSTGEVRYSRKRVIEALSAEMDEGDIIMPDLLNKSCSRIANDDCLRIDIFKKQQHGGLREIYVLDIHARILQLMIETISKGISDFFQSEVMTHPDNKQHIPYEHGALSKEKFGGDFISVSDSSDAEKWNQGHFVPKFAIMLKFFTKPIFHNFIDFTCSMFLKKRMMISPRLIESMNKLISTPVASPIFQKMIDAHIGKIKVPWTNRGARYIQTKSGMMQGILHYTSSLWHTVFLEWFKIKYCLELDRFTRMVTGEKPFRNTPHISSMQSSDDSSLIVSLPTSDQKLLRMQIFATSVMFKFRHMVGRLLGIYNSVKTTTFTPGVLEFNSEYYFGTNHFRPSFRWVSAALTITEQECLTSRQEEMSTNLSAILSGGCSTMTTFFMQISQLLLHYRCLGYDTSTFFSLYADRVMEIRDPGFGYFLLDNPFSAGLLGFRFNLWAQIRNGPLSCFYKSLLTKQLSKRMYDALFKTFDRIPQFSEKTLLNVTRFGTISSAVTFCGHTRDKLNSMLHRIGINPGWVKDIDSNPVILYRPSTSTDEILLKIAVKLNQQGVAQALSNQMNMLKLIGSTAYGFTRPAYSTNSYVDNSNYAFMRRYSLFYLMELSKKGTKDDLFLTEDEIRCLIPQSGTFEDTFNWLSRMKVLGSNISSRLKKKNVKVILDHPSETCLISLSTIVSEKWFGIENHVVATSLMEHYWKTYKDFLPWLKDTAQETLENSPFDNHIQLNNFIKSVTPKSRVVVLSGTIAKSIHGITNLKSIILNNFFPGFRLVHPECDLDPVERPPISLSSVKHCLRMISQSPFNMDHKILLTKNVLSSMENVEWSNQFLSSRSNELYLLKKACSLSEVNSKESEREMDSLIELISLSKKGILCCYTQPQKFSEKFKRYKGEGQWGCQIGSKRALINFNDNKIQSIIMESGFEVLILAHNMAHLFPKCFPDDSNKNSFRIRYRLGQREGVMQVHDGQWKYSQEFIEGRLKGVPVYSVQHIPEFISSSNVKGCEIDINQNSIRLKLKVLMSNQGETKPMIACSYRLNDSDVSCIPKIDVLNLCGSSFLQHDNRALADECMQNKDSYGAEAIEDPFLSWMSNNHLKVKELARFCYTLSESSKANITGRLWNVQETLTYFREIFKRKVTSVASTAGVQMDDLISKSKFQNLDLYSFIEQSMQNEFYMTECMTDIMNLKDEIASEEDIQEYHYQDFGLDAQSEDAFSEKQIKEGNPNLDGLISSFDTVAGNLTENFSSVQFYTTDVVAYRRSYDSRYLHRIVDDLYEELVKNMEGMPQLYLSKKCVPHKMRNFTEILSILMDAPIEVLPPEEIEFSFEKESYTI